MQAKGHRFDPVYLHQTKNKERIMVDRIVHIFAGMVIILSLLLGATWSPFFISEYALFLTLFVGANLLQYGFTNWCPLAMILRKFGVE